ncbi:hypothetical protein BC833DRAFT_569775 [Globomyces pollinis-pini]|nr:hypothetical protein BC833DRAFT_569775 [Globomyces pollinis-pini]
MVKTVPEFDASKVHFYPLVSDDSTHLVVQKTTDQQVMDKLFVHPELQYIKILVFRQHKRYILLESALSLLYDNPQQALKAKEYYVVPSSTQLPSKSHFSPLDRLVTLSIDTKLPSKSHFSQLEVFDLKEKFCRIKNACFKAVTLFSVRSKSTDTI